MTEQRGELPPVMPGDAAGTNHNLRIPPPQRNSAPAEAVYILGEGTCQAIESSVAALEELGELAATEDPFKNDSRPSEIDLSSLKPEYAAIVANYSRTSGPFKSLTMMQLTRFCAKVTTKASRLHSDMLDRSDFAAYCLDSLEEDIESTHQKLGEDTESPAVEILRPAMENVVDTADRVPSKATYQTVENAFQAAISGHELKADHLTRRTPMGRALGRAPKTTSRILGILKGELADYKELKGTINDLSNRGSRAFNALGSLIRAEQLREVVDLLTVIDTAKALLPTADELEENERDAVLAAEDYLTSQIDTVVSTIRDTAPDILDEKGPAEDLRRLSSPALATELQQKELGRKRAEVGENVIAGITEAKNVLRGGGRLKPARGQTEKEVRQKAKELHGLRDANNEKLLETEEGGVIMATVTGHFETFKEVVEKVKLHTSNGNNDVFPKDRAGVINEIKSFDLQKALEAISAILEDPFRSIYLDRVLSRDQVKKLKSVIEETLKPEEP